MSKNKVLVNDEINLAQVRLIDHDGQQLGIMSSRDALAKAQVQNLDLILKSNDAEPPVCKIGDWGKEKYDHKKQKKSSRKKQTRVDVKEIQLRPVTEAHDLNIKVKRAKKFLDEGKKVRFSMRFRGRESSHSEIGMKMMNEILTTLGEDITVEKKPSLNGQNILMVVAP